MPASDGGRAQSTPAVTFSTYEVTPGGRKYLRGHVSGCFTGLGAPSLACVCALQSLQRETGRQADRLRLPSGLSACRQNPTRQPASPPARHTARAATPDLPRTAPARRKWRERTRAALERLAADGAIGGYDLAGRGARQRLALWRPRPALPAPHVDAGECG